MPKSGGKSDLGMMTLKVVGVVLTLALFLILLLPRAQPMEQFSQPPTGFSSTGQLKALDSVRTGTSARYAMFDEDMKQGDPLLSDQFNLLLAKRCYQFHVKEDELAESFKALKQKSIPVEEGEFRFELNAKAKNNLMNTESYVLDILEKFKAKIGGKPVKGPVFAIVSQVPYYKNDSGGVLPVQFSAHEYHLKPYNVFKSKDGGYVKIKVAVLFPAYEANSGSIRHRLLPEAIRSSAEKKTEYLQSLIIDILKEKEVIRKYCFLECADNPSLLCGCHTSPNESSCLAPKRDATTDAEKSKPVESHYVVMYQVNKKNAQIALRGLLA